MNTNQAHRLFAATDRVPLPLPLRPIFGAEEVHPAVIGMMRTAGWLTPDVLEFMAGHARHVRATTPQHNLAGFMGCRFHGEDDRMSLPVNRLLKELRWGSFKYSAEDLPVEGFAEFLRPDWQEVVMPGRSFLADSIKEGEEVFREDIAAGLSSHVAAVFSQFSLDWENAEDLLNEVLWEYADWTDAHNSHCAANILPLEGIGGYWRWEASTIRIDASLAYGDPLCYGTRGMSVSVPVCSAPPVEEEETPPPVEEEETPPPPVRRAPPADEEEPVACPFRMGTLKGKPKSSKKRGKKRK